MPAAVPKSLTLTYPDGSTTSVSFHTLPKPLRDDLLRQPGLTRRDHSATPSRFMLLEWEDGWKEVTAVDAGSMGVKRYYVISRTEDVGRLALEHESGYPELVEINRRPLGLRRITFEGTFELKPGKTDREGDKTDRHFHLEPTDDSLETLAAGLAEVGGDPAAVGLVAGRSGQDLLDFVEAMTQRSNE
jgi:hypothetical protein